VTTPTPTDEATPALATIESLVGEVGRAVAASERKDLAGRLQFELGRWHASQGAVVVAGEASRGKSALINALVDRRNLLPVDVEVSSNVHVVVRHGPEAATVLLDGGPKEIGLDEVDVWACEAGNPGNVKGVRGVEISLEHPLLASGICLVDTPGVGGLDGGHAQLTLAALGGADALLFVVDSDAPISRPELAFLAQAAQRIATVIVAVTKIDQDPGWREVVDSDRRLLQEALPGLANVQVFPVSSRVKSKADDLAARGDTTLAAELHSESGFDPLERALVERVAGRVQEVRALNLLTVAEGLVAQLRRDSSVRLQALSGPTKDDELARARASLAELGKTNAAWTAKLSEELQVVGLDLRARLTQSIGDVRRRAEAALADAPPAALDGLVEGARSDLVAVSGALSIELEERAVAVAPHVAAEAGLDPVELAVDGLSEPDLLIDSDVPAPAGSGGGAALEAVGVISSGYAMQNMASWALGAALGAVALPLGAAAGVVVATLRRRQADRARNQQQARAQTASMAATATSQLQPALEKQLLGIRRQIERGVRAALDTRATSLRAAINEAERLQGRTTETRKQAQVQLKAALESLATLADGLSEARTALID